MSQPSPVTTIIVRDAFAKVIARVRAWAAANDWSKTQYAAEAGVVDTTLRHFHEPDWNPTFETLEKLEAVIPDGWQAGRPIPARRQPRRKAA